MNTMQETFSVGLGLYGHNGHQLQPQAIQQAGATLIAVCDYDKPAGTAVVCSSLETLLETPGIQLVSICAPVRAQQHQAVLCALRAGKHVLAEKPCVFTEAQLDEVLQTARQQGVLFYEMNDVFLQAPYRQAAELVRQGVLGTIVQVSAQKSYPYADWRPQNEDIDGGLMLQNGIYGFRFIEQVAGQRVCSLTARETCAGNPCAGGLRMAATVAAQLEGGGIASFIANYLNMPGTGVWGNEEVRIFGTKGILRTDIRTMQVELIRGDEKNSICCRNDENSSVFSHMVHSIATGACAPFSPEWLVRPTRLAIRARAAATGNSGFVSGE